MVEYVTIPASKLQEAAEAIYEEGKNRLIAMFANDECGLHGNYAIYCVFAVGKDFRVIKALLAATGALEFSSITPHISAAAWYEREIYDLFGLKPIGHPDLRALVLHENWPDTIYPLRKDFDVTAPVPTANRPWHMNSVEGEGVFEVPVGPIHAGIIEPGHFRFSQAGESILRLDAKMFFVHRGIEKAIEGLPLEKAFYQVERISGVCGVAHSLSYCHAIEALAGVEVPKRAQYMRALVAELERLYNHVGDIGNLCAGMGFAVAVMAGARMKEAIMRVNEAVTGNRFLRGMVVPGGVRQDITTNLADEIINLLDVLEPDFTEMIGLFRTNDAFLNRVNTTGVVSRQAALDLSVVGVGARASGVDIDSRRDYPYDCYSKLKFEVPVYTTGDVAARLWVRVDEVYQTMQLIRQIIAKMPDGALIIAIPEIKPYSCGFGWSESSQGHCIHWLMVGENNTIYRLFVRAAAYCNWPALTVAAPGNIIPDFPLVNKSYELSYACLDR
ncbi:NADH-quinone oxidoreductase subunit C [Sporomusa sp. KB1]|jgi:Ni,Fe-hydrogenase III large subunit/Ni,Fe-hydrogenase III component G|uniref:hydrogenase large subunit n=1 Tax=Sporomusa sp. KB1 TaxID=943346 RepID=UPI0011A3A429|nr:NADH-quinone oxidoreductase subunit C [Sporomusa sp. KB1]